ncbi:MAG: leucine--tRNA ligase [Nanoarchaeota archaeon]|nr:leucine--tRNA ligase [Nanoarchaeota archaeon]
MKEFRDIEEKWQKRWDKDKVFEVDENKKNKCYVLEMFPYPSGSGLHMGHSRNYAIGDVYARFKRLKGFNVLYPMGFDAFGLPAENAAIKEGIHPKEYTDKSIKSFTNQLKALGNSYSWSRVVRTCDVNYYKWNQLLFLKFLEKGLVYRKKAPVNWCEHCGTVLANEQVEQGECWRCHNPVEVKQLEQWFLKITKYADELLKDLKILEGWPEKIKKMQESWIGKSKGVEIKFKIKDGEELKVFTTRPDTLWGVTFMVLAPENPKVMELVKGTEKEKEVKRFIDKVVLEDKYERTAEDTEKEGLFIGKYAINPVNGAEVPIYIANFVVAEYGTGAVMAVPGHDQRDFEFAKKYKIPIKIVIKPKEHELDAEKMMRAFVDVGVVVNSADEFNGMNNLEAIEEIGKYLEKEKFGKRTVEYKLRDWLISRQRYWGTPIPIVYCDKCVAVPLNEKELPIKLPEDIKFDGEGNPLLKKKEFLEVKCPKCKGNGRRETDTMDTFFDSSWYFLRYCDSKNEKEMFSKKKVKYWMPVDQYIGGAEHAVLHLLYARFFVKALRDFGLLNFDEPFLKLFTQGVVYKEGARMSKSRGNVVVQDDMIERYGVDSVRVFLLSLSHPGKTVEWDGKGIEGAYKFMNKVYSLKEKVKIKDNSKDKNVLSKLNLLIKNIESDFENFDFNLVLSKVMGFVNYLYKFRENLSEEVYKESVSKLSIVLSCFAPHVCEELYGEDYVSLADWPQLNSKKIDLELENLENFVSSTISDINNVLKLVKIENPKKITLLVAEEWKYKLYEKVLKEGKGDMKFKVKGKEKESIKLLGMLKKKGLPKFILNQKKELEALESEKEFIEKEFKLKLEIKKDGEKALPGKVQILIE